MIPLKKAKVKNDVVDTQSGVALRMGQTIWIIGEDPKDSLRWTISLGPVTKPTGRTISIPKDTLAVQA